MEKLNERIKTTVLDGIDLILEIKDLAGASAGITRKTRELGKEELFTIDSKEKVYKIN